jgi:hypothetical protein
MVVCPNCGEEYSLGRKIYHNSAGYPIYHGRICCEDLMSKGHPWNCIHAKKIKTPDLTKPFENLKKQIDIIAEEMGLDENIKKYLKKVEHSLIASVPIKMENGNLENEDLDRINKELKRILSKAIEEIIAVSKKSYNQLRTAAFIIAVSRVVRAIELRGFFP